MASPDLRAYLAELQAMRAAGRHPDGRRIGADLAPRLDRIIETARAILNAEACSRRGA